MKIIGKPGTGYLKEGRFVCEEAWKKTMILCHPRTGIMMPQNLTESPLVLGK